MIHYEISVKEVIAELHAINALLHALGLEEAFVKLLVFTEDPEARLRGISADDNLALSRLTHSINRQSGKPVGFLLNDNRGRLLAKPLASCEAIEELGTVMKAALEVSRQEDLKTGRNPGPIQTLPGGWFMYERNADTKGGA
jgi:hypothetical protein